MSTARSQSRKSQLWKDKKANGATQVTVVQCHQDSVDKIPTEKEGASARGAAGKNIQSFFKIKRHRSEPEIQDSKEQEQQDSQERKRRSTISSTSSFSRSDCAHYIFSHVTVDFLVPDVQHIAP